MKLARNSWHAKLNKFTYGGEYLYNVDCLCPYFWGTILAILMFPFAVLFKGINRGLKALPKSNLSLPKINITYDTKQKLEKIIAVTLISLGLFGLSAVITWGIMEYGVAHVLFVIGIVVAFGAGIIGFAIGVVKLGERVNDWKNNRPKREKKPNLFWEMFKAKKNKHCPLVQWV